MPVDHLFIRNFKSFRETAIDLRQVTVVIGQSAAGKSNLILAIRLLRDIAAHGLAAAVAQQGGPRLLQNVQKGGDEPLTIGVGFTLPAAGFPVLSGTYTFSLLCTGDAYTIVEDRLDLAVPPTGDEGDTGGTVTIRHQQDLVEYRTDLPDGSAMIGETRIPSAAGGRRLDAGTLLLESDLPPMPAIAAFVSTFAIYRPDPRRSKQGTGGGRSSDLDEDGANLAGVLDRILAEPETGKRFVTLVQDLLPFIKEVTVSRSPDRTLLMHLRESFAAGVEIPASSLSDGTITLLILIAALYFTRHPLMVFEDPGTPVHPNLLARLVGMFYDAAGSAQMIVITHSPDIVRHVRLEDLLLVRRDPEGFSEVVRPVESHEVRTFIEEGVDAGDLYQQNLLGL